MSAPSLAPTLTLPRALHKGGRFFLPRHAGGGNIRLIRFTPVTALAIALLTLPTSVLAHNPGKDVRLPKIGPAPEFTLTTHRGKPFSLRDLRGKVVALTFIFTSCTDTCPMLTAKLVAIQRKLAADIKPKVFFAAITVDPERDTPQVLKRYAQAYNADPAHWAFLTGSPAEIDDVTRRYGIYHKQQAKGDVDHTFLTSLIDKEGTLRVQYLGVRFNPKEFSDDLRALTREQLSEKPN
ncbi:MAG: SCO family protein [Chloroflexota bacterium]|nr:SCO family protein [Chloroflexota bacterium]